MTERVPVIIPAFNEAGCIARTLDRLPADLVEPLVAVNGSTDNTAEIAERFGARVITSPDQGNLPIIQEALRHLGKRALLPLIILDADTYPLLPKRWHNSNLKELAQQSDAPQVVTSPAWFVGGDLMYATIHSLRRLRNTYRDNDQGRLRVCGPSVGLNLKYDEVLEAVLALPHIWPRQEIALVDSVVAQGGQLNQSLSPSRLVITPLSESYPSLAESLRMGKEQSRRVTQVAYVERAAPGSITYEAYLSGRQDDKKGADQNSLNLASI